MTELEKFTATLKRHPGLQVAVAMNGLGFVVGILSPHPPTGFVGGLLGVVLTSIFWIPVLWTAWTGRNDEP